jgi:hypothetical protein
MARESCRLFGFVYFLLILSAGNNVQEEANPNRKQACDHNEGFTAVIPYSRGLQAHASRYSKQNDSNDSFQNFIDGEISWVGVHLCALHFMGTENLL